MKYSMLYFKFYSKTYTHSKAWPTDVVCIGQSWSIDMLSWQYCCMELRFLESSWKFVFVDKTLFILAFSHFFPFIGFEFSLDIAILGSPKHKQVIVENICTVVVSSNV